MKPFKIAGMEVPPGRRKDVRVRISELSTATPVFIPVTVVHGARPGPALFVTAAIHGDEINGIEIVRQMRLALDPARLRGTAILVMIANPISFLAMMRDLPDGRDLNRSFPGRDRGSLAAHIADAIFSKIIRLSDYGIDLHTAAAGRSNLPHVRADLSRPVLRRLAAAFGCEVIFDVKGEKGMLRAAATEAGVPTVVYEAGEPLRFQKGVVARGVAGVSNVMADLKMYDFGRRSPRFQIVVRDHRWVRSKRGGILDLRVKPGDIIEKGQTIAVNTRPFGTGVRLLKAPYTGLVVSCTTVPLAVPGSAVCHLVPLDVRYRVLKSLLHGPPPLFE